MKIVGSPSVTNDTLKQLVSRIVVNSERVDLRNQISSLCKENALSVLDIGESLREFRLNLSPATNYRTLDLLPQGNPHYLADICDVNLTNQIAERFDIVCCFSLLEHVYDPFAAAKNLFNLASNNGLIIGYVPFLFPRHAPENLTYQDFFRFTRDGIGILFPNARKVEVWPDRGRFATALVCLSSSYKYIFEKRFPKSSSMVSSLMRSGRHQLQTSGFQFRITK